MVWLPGELRRTCGYLPLIVEAINVPTIAFAGEEPCRSALVWDSVRPVGDHCVMIGNHFVKKCKALHRSRIAKAVGSQHGTTGLDGLEPAKQQGWRGACVNLKHRAQSSYRANIHEPGAGENENNYEPTRRALPASGDTADDYGHVL